MRRYIVGRLLLMIPTLVGVAILTFVIMRAVPGDIVALRYAGSSVPQDVIDQERHILGLDKPMWAQFVDWMTSISRFDLGQSLWTGHSVVEEVQVRVPLSIELAVLATLFAVALAIPLGVVAAVKQDSWIDYAIRVFSIGGLAMPSFWIGIMMVLITLTLWGWAPPVVFTPLFDEDFVFAVAREHPLARKRRLSAADVAAAPQVYISPRDASFSGQADQALRALGLTRFVRLSVPSFAAAVDVIEHSELAAILPRHVALAAACRVASQPLPFAMGGFTMEWVTHPRADDDSAIAWLRGEVLAAWNALHAGARRIPRT